MFDVKELKLRRNTWIRSSGIPSHLIGWELSDCIEVPADVSAVINGWLSSVKSGKIINAIGERSCGRGMAFYGSPGRGKTTVAQQLFKRLCELFHKTFFL